jgi:uncharacterized protein (DUF2267 family)
MKNKTVREIANAMLLEAKNNYDAIQFLESLDDPLMIKDRDTALRVCRVIMLLLRKVMGVKEGCIIDQLLQRLTDYISRQEGHGN